MTTVSYFHRHYTQVHFSKLHSPERVFSASFCSRGLSTPDPYQCTSAERWFSYYMTVVAIQGLTLPGATMFSLPTKFFCIWTTLTWFSCQNKRGRSYEVGNYNTQKSCTYSIHRTAQVENVHSIFRYGENLVYVCAGGRHKSVVVIFLRVYHIIMF